MTPKKQSEKLNVGSQLVRYGFVGADANLKAVIDLLIDAGLEYVLSEPVVVMSREVMEFYSNAKINDSGKAIKTTVAGTYIRLTARGLSTALKMNRLSKNEEEDEISNLDTTQALEWCSYTEKLYSSIYRIKMSQRGKLLADIVGKVLICKPGSHDRISRDMFCLMTRIILKKKTDWGKVLFEKIKESINSPNFGRIISLYLCCTLNDKIDESLGSPIHHMKKISLKTLDMWEKIIPKPSKKDKGESSHRGNGTMEEEEREPAVPSLEPVIAQTLAEIEREPTIELVVKPTDTDIRVDDRIILDMETLEWETLAESSGQKDPDVSNNVDVGKEKAHVEPPVVEAEINYRELMSLKGKRIKVEERVASPIYIPDTRNTPDEVDNDSLMEDAVRRGENWKGSDIPRSFDFRSQEEPFDFMLDQMRILLAEQRRYFENYVDMTLEKVKKEISTKMDSMSDDIDHINAQMTSKFIRVASAVDNNYKALKSLNDKLESTHPEDQMIVDELESTITFLTEKIAARKNDTFRKDR